MIFQLNIKLSRTASRQLTHKISRTAPQNSFTIKIMEKIQQICGSYRIRKHYQKIGKNL